MTLALGDRLIDVETLGGSHPATDPRHCSRILGKRHGSNGKQDVQHEREVTWFLEERPLYQTGILWLAMLLEPYRSLDNELTQT